MTNREKTREAIREHYGTPHPRVIAKQLTSLDRHARRFIELSPFLVIASSDAEGRCDATPRGGAPGFVGVVDDHTLIVPDRPGNRRVDTMLNLAENSFIGLLFLVPGIDETLRVNGQAKFTSDGELLRPLSANGKPPIAGLVITVQEVFFHCGKALIRSQLWNPESKVARSSFPSLGRILSDQIHDIDVAESERSIEESYKNRLY